MLSVKLKLSGGRGSGRGGGRIGGRGGNNCDKNIEFSSFRR
jgi:hypothetical protein